MRLFRLVVLKDRTAQHITCVDSWRNTSEITFSAVMRMRKWLLAVHAGFWMQEPDFHCDGVFWICAKTGEIHWHALGSKMGSEDTAVEQTDYI